MAGFEETSTLVTEQADRLLAESQQGRASLVVLHGSQMGASFPLEEQKLSIGRGVDCDIQVEDENVSRKHAEIFVEGDKYSIRDLGSTNGTYVNSRRVAEATLEDGDLVMLSSTVFKFLASSSIENRFFDQMYSMITTDFQTKLHNRRYLASRLEEEVSRARRHHRPLALVIFDLDRFKQVNDTFGHAAGDLLLRKSAQILNSQLRHDDVFARIGGDEFCVLCPETTLQQGLQLAERLRNLMADTTFSFKRQKLTVSISVGVAEFVIEMGSPEELMAAADRALYQAKSEGRDRVCA
ncbi:MAG: GGDEF domain-containing protein [bacterium]